MEKKPESSGEELEQLGPYQLHEQVPQDELGRGELYRTTHETSGVTALVLKPATEDSAVPLRDWRVRCVSSASHGYVAMEVVDSRWVRSPDEHGAGLSQVELVLSGGRFRRRSRATGPMVGPVGTARGRKVLCPFLKGHP